MQDSAPEKSFDQVSASPDKKASSGVADSAADTTSGPGGSASKYESNSTAMQDGGDGKKTSGDDRDASIIVDEHGHAMCERCQVEHDIRNRASVVIVDACLDVCV